MENMHPVKWCIRHFSDYGSMVVVEKQIKFQLNDEMPLKKKKFVLYFK